MFKQYHIPSTESTNTHLRRLLQNGTAHTPCVLRADKQTAGKGRSNRFWDSPKGNLYASFALPSPQIKITPQLGFVMSLAAHDTLSEFLPTSLLKLKWPNDILYDDKKIGGLLLENQDGIIIIGIGLNIISAPKSATCLANNMETNPPPATKICDILTTHFYHRYEFWQTQGWDALMSEWQSRSHNIGDRLSVHWLGALQNGTFAGLGNDGSLLLEADAELLHISAGDVFLGDL